MRSSAVFQAAEAFGWRTYARDRGVQQTEEDVRFFEAFWRHAGPLRTPARRAGAAQLATRAVRSAGQDHEKLQYLFMVLRCSQRRPGAACGESEGRMPARFHVSQSRWRDAAGPLQTRPGVASALSHVGECRRGGAGGGGAGRDRRVGVRAAVGAAARQARRPPRPHRRRLAPRTRPLAALPPSPACPARRPPAPCRRYSRRFCGC